MKTLEQRAQAAAKKENIRWFREAIRNIRWFREAIRNPIEVNIGYQCYLKGAKEETAELQAKLEKAVGALEKIKSRVGTSTEAWHISDEALRSIREGE